jgi:hypothetical protein
MIFVHQITTPANTAKDSPLRTTMPIVLGTITRVLIFLPPGLSGLAHLKILWGLYQLFPSNEQGDFAGAGELIEWDEQITIDTPPDELVAVTWNEDDTYDHTIIVHIVMEPALPSQSISEVIAAVNAPPSGGSA